MGKKDKKDKKDKKIKVTSNRSDKKIVDQFTRKFRHVIQSSGIQAASDWLSRGPTREIGRTVAKRTIVLPMKKLWGILDKAALGIK